MTIFLEVTDFGPTYFRLKKMKSIHEETWYDNSEKAQKVS